jgi:hypothetical protein
MEAPSGIVLKSLSKNGFSQHTEGTPMEGITKAVSSTGCENGFSVIMAEKVLTSAGQMGLPEQWRGLTFGRPSRRSTAYPYEHRIASVVAGLACGLRGIGPGNRLLRTNSAIQELTGGRFPDQGTIHRWLDGMTDDQAAALRSHLHAVARKHGQFWKRLRSEQRLIVDIDAQGLPARGPRHQQAARGYLGEGLDQGYQRYVMYAAETCEVLDEVIRPGNTNLMGELPQMLIAANEIFPHEWRDRVILRIDAHGGTAANLLCLHTEGYHYLTRMQSASGVKRMRRELATTPGQTFEACDSKGLVHTVEFWDQAAWTFRGRSGIQVTTRAILLKETLPTGREFWWVLLTDLSEAPAELWTCYHQRGGTIEEYNDQSEQAFHLEVIRTGNPAGLCALHALVGVCWNLIRWLTTDLELPPTQSPQADRSRWVPARHIACRDLMDRASHSGLKLFRTPNATLLEVEDTAVTPESSAWLRWLHQPIQRRFLLAA